MAKAATVPELLPGRAPVSFLIDFDGTVALTDVTDTIVDHHALDEAWHERDAAYLSGLTGSRELLAWDLSILPPDAARLVATADAQPLDQGFPEFVRRLRDRGAEVEIVSDGFGFYVEPMLARLGLGDLPVATAAMNFDPPAIEFPYGHPRCFVCGTCKRERVLAHRSSGRLVVFVGDGESDRYAASQSDFIYAKGYLARVCLEREWRFEPWETFNDLAGRVDRSFEEERLPSDAAGLAEARARAGPRRPFICGPEVWGPGRWAPPTPDDRGPA